MVNTQHAEWIIPISAKDFSELRKGKCLFWKTWPRRQFSSADGLSFDDWDLLQRAVRGLKRQLRTRWNEVRNSEQIARLLCGIGVKTNPVLVEGLSRKHKWWLVEAAS